MKYGYFDDEKKEYVIERPDTPRSWSNYLGDTKYGAIITNNAGGYSFFQSAAQGRFMRLRFNAIPMDQPGRYIYIHDKESKDYWSAAWQPVGKSLDEYKTECRHGTAYTIINSEYSKIKTETVYFVPLEASFECWHFKITNTDSVKRNLGLFTFVEYANNWNVYQDSMNLQYTQYIVKMDIKDNIIDHGINVLLPDGDYDFTNHDQNRHTFIGIAGANISGFDTEREIFLGPYRSYHNPIAVELGKCSQSVAVSGNGCGTLQVDADLSPGQSKEFTVIMGIGKADKEGKEVISKYNNMQKVYSDFKELKKYWHERLEGFTMETPDEKLNSMGNMWNPFNCLITYSWSRAASLIYSGARDGLGYRDTVQDLLGVLHTIPEEAGKRLELMITGQVSNGGAMPVVKPFNHNPGNEKPPLENEYRSDDCMWLFSTVPGYVKETGNIDFFKKVLPFSDDNETTVLGHLKRAIEFNLERSGKHGLPSGLYADWNDCLELGQNGETVFVSLQLRFALKTYIEICKLLKEQNEKNQAEKKLKELDNNIEKYAWDGEWYLRAIRYDGLKYGSKENDEGSIWLNPQSWAVLSGHASTERSENIMGLVNKRLATQYGLMICDPPYEKTDHRVIKAPLFNKGMKENGSIFCHTQGWAVAAETILGHGNRAFEYYKAFLPAAYNEKADIREIEPYVYSQFTHSKSSPHFGASRLPWLSGTASWAYYTLTQYILGIRPDYSGLVIDPCIPDSWDLFTVKRRFRGMIFEITVKNPDRIEKGIKQIIFNNKALDSNFISESIMENINIVEVIMG